MSSIVNGALGDITGAGLAALPVTNQTWAALLLIDAGLPTTDNNVNNIMSWMEGENTPDNWFNRNNPLNSGQGPSGGDSGLGSYADLSTAAHFTAQLINEPNMSVIQQALAANAPFDVFLRAIQSSPWDGGYASGIAAPGTVPIVSDSGQTLSINSAGAAAGSSGGSSPADIQAEIIRGSGIILPPAPGMASSISADQFFINDAPMDVDVSGALIDIGLTLDATQASVLEITLHDPAPRTLLNSVALQEKSAVTIDGLTFEMVAVEKQASKVIATFEPWVVAALRSAVGPVTLPPGIMTRTAFANMLVNQVQGAVFTAASPSYLYTLDAGYDANTKEQLSRGTMQNPREDSWACLQRLASEIGWRCYEIAGAIFFGPDSYRMVQPSVATLAEFTNGVQTIDGTFDIGQPLGTLTINDVSGSWAPLPGALVNIAGLGALGGPWLVVTLERASIFHPDVVITCQQPQPSLPEPASGGAQAAVGAGFSGSQQSTTGSAAAAQALQYAINQLGVPYLWGGENPQTGFDCSGLMQAAYASAGKTINRTSEAQWAEFPRLAPGGNQLRAGDLVYFTGSDGNPPGHVGMFVSYDSATNTAKMVDAPFTGAVVRYDTFTPDVGASDGWGYMGANRPSP